MEQIFDLDATDLAAFRLSWPECKATGNPQPRGGGLAALWSRAWGLADDGDFRGWPIALSAPGAASGS